MPQDEVSTNKRVLCCVCITLKNMKYQRQCFLDIYIRLHLESWLKNEDFYEPRDVYKNIYGSVCYNPKTKTGNYPNDHEQEDK